MVRVKLTLVAGSLLFLCGSLTWAVEAQPEPVRTRDVIYGRKAGLALTMDVFAPKTGANGAGVIYVVSGGWFSRPEMIHPDFFSDLLRRGYTVFAVVHGSQPKFTVPEVLDDMHRAVRFIRYHAKDYRIDPEKLGITGLSAGGHLSLMQGTAGLPANPKADDPVERCSSRVQAVACFFPATDFLNFGKAGFVKDVKTMQPPFTAAVDFKEYDRSVARYLPVTEADKVREILKKISPITHVTADDPPTLIIHGDADDLVPLQQSQVIVAKFKEVGVPVELIVKKGARHGWPTMANDLKTCGDWFDRHLCGKTAPVEPKAGPK
jgi:acetyl esterase/lipase